MSVFLHRGEGRKTFFVRVKDERGVEHFVRTRYSFKKLCNLMDAVEVSEEYGESIFYRFNES